MLLYRASAVYYSSFFLSFNSNFIFSAVSVETRSSTSVIISSLSFYSFSAAFFFRSIGSNSTFGAFSFFSSYSSTLISSMTTSSFLSSSFLSLFASSSSCFFLRSSSIRFYSSFIIVLILLAKEKSLSTYLRDFRTLLNSSPVHSDIIRA